MESIDWSTPDSCAAGLRREVGRFIADRDGRPWRVAWCAGAGFVGANEGALEVERAALAATLDTLSTAPDLERGALFFASSAGGVYAGAGSPPYDEASPVRALTAYGDAKLREEKMVNEWSREVGASALVGRITTLYGPGQNLAKPQGIISQVCRSYLSGRPSSIYVPLDTIRDYLFVTDCARLIADGFWRLGLERTASGSSVVTKILASQRPITVGAVLGEMRRVFKGSMPIVIAASPFSSLQARDLSVRSRVWRELDHRTMTPLPVGISQTAAEIMAHLQRGELGHEQSLN